MVWEQAGGNKLETPLMASAGTIVSDIINPGGGLKR